MIIRMALEVLINGNKKMRLLTMKVLKKNIRRDQSAPRGRIICKEAEDIGERGPTNSKKRLNFHHISYLTIFLLSGFEFVFAFLCTMMSRRAAQA